MPLDATGLPPSIQLEGVRFAMKNGEAIVPVFVTAEALQDWPGAPVDYGAAFELCRSAAEDLASDLFDQASGKIAVPIVIDSRALNPGVWNDPSPTRYR